MEFIQGFLEGNAIEAIVGVVLSLLSIGFVLKAKAIFGKGAKVTKEIGEFFLATSGVFEAADNAIKEDGSLKENSIKEIIAAGKKAKLEWQDVIIEIKPKKNKALAKGGNSVEPKMPPFPPKKNA